MNVHQTVQKIQFAHWMLNIALHNDKKDAREEQIRAHWGTQLVETVCDYLSRANELFAFVVRSLEGGQFVELYHGCEKIDLVQNSICSSVFLSVSAGLAVFEMFRFGPEEVVLFFILFQKKVQDWREKVVRKHLGYRLHHYLLILFWQRPAIRRRMLSDHSVDETIQNFGCLGTCKVVSFQRFGIPSLEFRDDVTVFIERKK